VNRRSTNCLTAGLLFFAIASVAPAEEGGSWERPRLEETLKKALQGATRVRLRSGCVCCSGRDQLGARRTRVEETDPEAIRRLIEAIRIVEPEPGSTKSHACCGDGRVCEFYRGDELLAAVSLDHGTLLRWRGWNTDAELTKESADALARWLAEHGIRGLKEERTRQKAALQRRVEESRRLMPAALAESAAKVRPFSGWLLPGYTDHSVRSDEGVNACRICFEENVPDPRARPVLYFRLYGVDEASWRHCSGLDDVLERGLLPSLGKADLAEAIRGLLEDPQGLDGAARWLLGKKRWSAVEEKDLLALLPDLARRALGHPHADNRALAIAALGEIRGEEAAHLLRDVLSARIEVRGPAMDDLGLPAGGFPVPVVSSPWGCSDRAHAALLLARLGDKESLLAIRDLAKTAAKADARALAEALDLLGR
jgi:hypothetical protein